MKKLFYAISLMFLLPMASYAAVYKCDAMNMTGQKLTWNDKTGELITYSRDGSVLLKVNELTYGEKMVTEYVPWSTLTEIISSKTGEVVAYLDTVGRKKNVLSVVFRGDINYHENFDCKF